MTDLSSLIAPAPGTPPCRPPTRDADGVWLVTRHAEVRAVLTDPAFGVPEAPPGPPGTLAWFRGNVARFSSPRQHPGRRALAVATLAGLDPDLLRRDAARLTATLYPPATVAPTAGGAVAGPPDVAGAPARGVPVRVLAGRLGLAGPDEAAVRRADEAVAALVAMSPPGPPDAVANRIGLLVQACAATDSLIVTAARYAATLPASVPTEVLLAEVLRLDPPVRATRRVAGAGAAVAGHPVPAGATVLLRFDAANRDPACPSGPDGSVRPTSFGVGAHRCPGERHALALAAGVVDVLRAAPCPMAGRTR
ncbi:cytochrome P450 [Micromonospora sp. CPCC 205711]|uniref:cytochrome P450 n=1 Tax=Micromonospora sp. CPCC 205547 TaxID=3122400 RepID=UPI002FEF1C25